MSPRMQPPPDYHPGQDRLVPRAVSLMPADDHHSSGILRGGENAQGRRSPLEIRKSLTEVLCRTLSYLFGQNCHWQGDTIVA